MGRLKEMGITEENFNDILDTDKLVPGNNIIFSASAVTSGDFLRGVNLFGGGDAKIHAPHY